MALKVWLPLNGNLENKGLSSLTFNNVSANFSEAGKLGKQSCNGRFHFVSIPTTNSIFNQNSFSISFE